jgi:hypothetical protein
MSHVEIGTGHLSRTLVGVKKALHSISVPPGPYPSSNPIAKVIENQRVRSSVPETSYIRNAKEERKEEKKRKGSVIIHQLLQSSERQRVLPSRKKVIVVYIIIVVRHFVGASSSSRSSRCSPYRTQDYRPGRDRRRTRVRSSTGTWGRPPRIHPNWVCT